MVTTGEAGEDDLHSHDDPNIDTRTIYGPDCTVVLSQATSNTILPTGTGGSFFFKLEDRDPV
jgi:hypothetical protein